MSRDQGSGDFQDQLVRFVNTSQITFVESVKLTWKITASLVEIRPKSRFLCFMDRRGVIPAETTTRKVVLETQKG